MSKIDWVEVAQVALAVGSWVFGRAMAKFSTIKKDWDLMRKTQVIQEQRLTKAWETIDDLKINVKKLQDEKSL